MIIKKLQLKHFRNYDDLTLDFDEKVNVFVGNNAQGKTNILESIYALAITKSHRTHLDVNLIKTGNKYCKVKGVIKKKNEADDIDLEIIISAKGKKVSINKKPIKKISDYISYLNVIIFHPDDLEILKGAPSERRKFMNIEIGQLDNYYFNILNNYNKILKNRNIYLKKITVDGYDKSYLEIITNQLIDCAIKIYIFRNNFINDINRSLAKVNEKIKGFSSLEIKYESGIVISEPNEIRNTLSNKYQSVLKKEIIMSQTMVGPHRDDFIFFANGKNIREFGSQGQQRIAVLSLKLAEIELFKEKKGEYPILLLDDIFSELDSVKRRNVIRYIDKRMQIMITTTDISDIEKNILKKASISSVDKALVKKIKQKNKAN